MIFNREFLTNIINLYRNLPCLWQTSHDDYYDKKKRNEALGILVDAFKEKYPIATPELVLKKLNTMRGTYRKELNKIRMSKRYGPNKTHVPKLWYFNLLEFLEDQKDRQRLQNLESITDKMLDEKERVFNVEQENMPIDGENSNLPDPLEIEIESFDYPAISSSTQSSVGSRLTRKKPKKHSEHELITIDGEIVEEIPRMSIEIDDQLEIFGKHVTAKLRLLNRDQRIYAEKLINDTLFEAELGNLHRNAKIILE